jgi:hypothetical protein
VVNRSNPNPQKPVRWGDRSEDEMMTTWTEVIAALPAGTFERIADRRLELFTALPAESRIRRVHRTATHTSADLGGRARLVGRANGILEVLDRAANTSAKLGKAVRPENDKHDDEDDEQFW